MKFRLVKRTMLNGCIDYEIEKRCFWLWMPFKGPYLDEKYAKSVFQRVVEFRGSERRTPIQYS